MQYLNTSKMDWIINPLAFAIGGFPSGPFPSVTALYYPEPVGGSTALKRYQWNMDGQSMFWKRGEAHESTTDSWRYEFECNPLDLTNGGLLGAEPLTIDGSALYIDGVGAATPNALVVRLGIVAAAGSPFFAVFDQLVPAVGEISKVVFSGDLANLTAELNGVSQSVTAPVNYIKPKITNIGWFSDFAPLSGSIPAVNMIDPASAANSYTYKLDGNAPYALPIGDELGVELWEGYDYSPANSGVVVVVVPNHSWDISTPNGSPSNLGYGGRVEVIPTVIGMGYEYRVGSSDAVNISVFNSSFVLIGSSLDGSPVIFTATSTNTKVYVCPRDASVVRVFGPSIKEIPASALTRENSEPSGSDLELITRKGDNSGWIGEDEWSPRNKNIIGNADAPDDDSVVILERGTPLAGVSIAVPTAGQLIRLTGDANILGGQVDISPQFGLGGVAGSITTSGPFSFDVVANGGIGFKRAFGGGAEATLTNVRARPIYNYADGAIS